MGAFVTRTERQPARSTVGLLAPDCQCPFIGIYACLFVYCIVPFCQVVWQTEADGCSADTPRPAPGSPAAGASSSTLTPGLHFPARPAPSAVEAAPRRWRRPCRPWLLRAACCGHRCRVLPVCCRHGPCREVSAADPASCPRESELWSAMPWRGEPGRRGAAGEGTR